MLIFGVKWMLATFRLKDVVEFPLSKKEEEFEISKLGRYALCIVGGGYVKGLEGLTVKLVHLESGEKIEVEEVLLKPRFRKHWKISIECLHFMINKSGNFRIEIEPPERLRVNRSMLIFKRSFQAPEPIENLSILIKETNPVIQRILGIVFLVLGANLLVWGIILRINPGIFG